MPIRQLYPFTMLVFMNPVEAAGVQMIQWLDILAYDRLINDRRRGRINYLPIDITNEGSASRHAREKVRMWSQGLFNCQDVQRYIADSKQVKIRFPTDELERAGYRVEFTRFGHGRIDIAIHLTHTNEMLTCDTLYTGFHASKGDNPYDRY